MGVVLVPVSDQAAKKNLKKSLFKKVALSRLQFLMDDDLFRHLSEHYSGGEASIWGTNLLITGGVKPDWQSMATNDLVLFGSTPGEGVIAMSRLVTTLRSKVCSAEIWGTPKFECLYFLENIVVVPPGTLPKSEVNKRLLKKGGEGSFVENFHWPGLQRVPMERAYELIDTLSNQPEALFPALLSPETNPVFGELPENLDCLAFARTRVEQSILRSMLLKERREANCVICGDVFPVEFLVAGHIKRRSLCTQEEKRDLHNIGALFCSLGCDHLYENGWISVSDSGEIVTRTTGATAVVQARLAVLCGRKSLHHNKSNSKYYDHHRDF